MAKETLKSRERVIRAIEHKPLDRYPIDFGMHFSSGISCFAYYNLRKYLGLSTDHIYVPDMIQLLAEVDDDILERFHVDCKLLYPDYAATKLWNPRGEYSFHIPQRANPVQDEDGSWRMTVGNERLYMPKGGFFFDGGWPDFHEDDWGTQIDKLAQKAERLYKETDYFLSYLTFGAFFSSDLDYLCDMLTDPDSIKAQHEQWLEGQIAQAKLVIDKLGGYVQGVLLNSDLGTQTGPFCNPAVYADVCAPYLKRFCDFMHRNSDFKLLLHSCGSIEPFIPILIDCGIDAINPVQVSAANMEPHHLKQAYGDKITFWGGGCNTQTVLNFGTPEDVRENVRYLTNIFKKDSGFVFNQVHNVMGDIAPENVVAMFDEAYANSFYD